MIQSGLENGRGGYRKYSIKVTPLNRFFLFLCLLNGTSTRAACALFGVSSSFISKDFSYILKLICQRVGPKIISFNSPQQMSYSDPIFKSVGPIDNFYATIFRPHWDIHTPYYRHDKGYNISSCVFVNHLGNCVFIYSGCKGSSSDRNILSTSGLPFEKNFPSNKVLVNGGFHGQTPGNIVLINPETAGLSGPVYKSLQKWLRVIVEIRIGLIANFGIFSTPFKFKRSLVPFVVYTAAVLSELEVAAKPIKSARHVQDYVNILTSKYQISEIE